MLNHFKHHDFNLDTGVRIHGLVGGQGMPLVLLHGHPQTHVMWHRVADALTSQFQVVMLDLRGYGDSSRPRSDSQHLNHSKRAMARDVVDVLAQLGHSRFAVCAHDRGARVAHRLAMDHPEAVSRMMLLDIAPTLAMYRDTREAFARAYWHWFFLIQPSPLPERLIESDPVAYLRSMLGRRAGLSMFDPQALFDYERCLSIPGSATSVCEDYRAAATIDLIHDQADRDAGRRLSQPLRVLWGGLGTVAQCFDVLRLWREVADAVEGRTLDCGHYIAEEQPDALLVEMQDFFIANAESTSS